MVRRKKASIQLFNYMTKNYLFDFLIFERNGNNYLEDKKLIADMR